MNSGLQASRHASPPESSPEPSQTSAPAAESGAVAPEVHAEPGDGERENPASRDTESENGAFPIVGIGASAGGLDAFRSLLHHLPTRTGMAFVLILELSGPLCGAERRAPGACLIAF